MSMPNVLPHLKLKFFYFYGYKWGINPDGHRKRSQEHSQEIQCKGTAMRQNLYTFSALLPSRSPEQCANGKDWNNKEKFQSKRRWKNSKTTSRWQISSGVGRALAFRREGPGFESLSCQCRKCDGARLTHLMVNPRFKNCLSFLNVSDSISTQQYYLCRLNWRSRLLQTFATFLRWGLWNISLT